MASKLAFFQKWTDNFSLHNNRWIGKTIHHSVGILKNNWNGRIVFPLSPFQKNLTFFLLPNRLYLCKRNLFFEKKKQVSWIRHMSMIGAFRPMSTHFSDFPSLNSNYPQKLSDEIRKLENVKQKTQEEKESVIEHFMEKIGDLFLEYFQNNLEQARECGEKHKSTLIDGSDTIENFYLSILETTLDLLDEGEWVRVCQLRTNIEAFNSMFEGISQLETALVEERMKRIGPSHGLPKEDITPGVPQSHWWWYC